MKSEVSQDTWCTTAYSNLNVEIYAFEGSNSKLQNAPKGIVGYLVHLKCHHNCSYKRGRGRFPTYTEEEGVVWPGKQRWE